MEAVTCVSIEPAWSFVCPTFQCSQSSITSVLSLYISHARLTSVKVAFNFFLPLISRCIFHRNKRSCIDSGKTQWQWSWAKWKFNISSAPLLFNPSTFLSQSTSPAHLFILLLSSTSIGMSALWYGVYSIYAPVLCRSHASLYWKAAFSLANGPCHNGNCRWILCEQLPGSTVRYSGENFLKGMWKDKWMDLVGVHVDWNKCAPL